MAEADGARRRRGGDVPLARRVVVAGGGRRLEVLGGQGLGQAGEVLGGDELEPLARGRDGEWRGDVVGHLDSGFVCFHGSGSDFEMVWWGWVSLRKEVSLSFLYVLLIGRWVSRYLQSMVSDGVIDMVGCVWRMCGVGDCRLVLMSDGMRPFVSVLKTRS